MTLTGTKFGKSILRKIIKIVVIRISFHSLKLKCTEYDFGPLGELTALPRPPSWI